MGVYSSYDSDTHKSVWVILQPSIHIFKNLEILFQKVVSTSSGFSVHAGFNIHNFFLSSVERKWHHYLEHLRATLDDTVRQIGQLRSFLLINVGGKGLLLENRQNMPTRLYPRILRQAEVTSSS